jgi:protein-disulfide isomerase
MKTLPALALALIATAAIAAPAPKRAAPVVSGETAGGFRFGSTAARVRLVEYGSLNCQHCAAFAAAANPAIIRAVKSGRMLYEYRPFAVFPQDIPAHALAKCVPAGARLAFIDDYYRSQKGVYDRFQAATKDPAADAALTSAIKAGEAQAAAKLAEVGGMLPIAARHGLPPAAARRCIAAPANLRWVGSTTAAANAAGVESTPTFELNGKRTPLPQVLTALGVR